MNESDKVTRCIRDLEKRGRADLVLAFLSKSATWDLRPWEKRIARLKKQVGIQQ